MNRTARLVVAGGILATALAGAGCSDRAKILWKYPHAEMETLSEPGEEHFHRVSTVDQMDRRGLAEDLDLFFMTDRPTRLTRWQSK